MLPRGSLAYHCAELAQARAHTMTLADTLIVEAREHPELLEQFRQGDARPPP